MRNLLKPYTIVDKQLISQLKKSESVESEVLLDFIKQNHRLPGELWTPLHNIVSYLFLIAIVLSVVCLTVGAFI